MAAMSAGGKGSVDNPTTATPFRPPSPSSLYTDTYHATSAAAADAAAAGTQPEEDSASDSSGDPDTGTLRKRKRPMSVSCELCKQRKVKCSRGTPSCDWCARNGQVCEYKERKKPGLRAGYGKELEARLDRLDSLLQAQQATISQIIAAIPSLAVQNPQPSADPFSSPTPAAVLQQAQDQDRSAYSPYNRSLEPPTYSKPDSPSRIPVLQQYYTSASGFASSTAADARESDELPPYDLLYALADLYFKQVGTWCPILHRKTTLDALFGSSSSLDEEDNILLHAIVATTLRFSSDARLTPASKSRYHAISKQRVLLYGLEHSSVKVLQALVILALDQVGISNGPPGWNLLAIITRSAVQLGLSIEPTSQTVTPRFPSIYTLRAMIPTSASFIEEESRRRLFWMIYILDRYATITTAFDFALDEHEIDRKLPCRDDLFNKNQPIETRWFRAERLDDKPENLGSFSFYVECVAILSQIHQFLKKPVDIACLSDVERWQHRYRELDSLLNSWKLGLPREYGNMVRLMDQSAAGKNQNCGWIMLHATYHTTIMRLHSSAAYPTHRSPIFMPSYSASQRCMTAVEQVSSLCAHVRGNGMLNKLGPPFAFSVWVAARLMLVHSSTIDHQVSPNIHHLVNTLREMGEYWAVADRYASLLQRVLDEALDAERAQGGMGQRVTPSSVKVLADMRRNAYDVDFLLQQLAPASSLRPEPMMQRALAGNELEYLDVWDFFNMPRLPALGEQGNIGTGLEGAAFASGTGSEVNNVTNFMYDANADWFTKPGADQ